MSRELVRRRQNAELAAPQNQLDLGQAGHAILDREAAQARHLHGFAETITEPVLHRLDCASFAWCLPEYALDVNFQEVVHSILAGNADVAKPQ